MEGILHELYDVVALPGIRRPQAIGRKTDEIRRIATIDGLAKMTATQALPGEKPRISSFFHYSSPIEIAGDCRANMERATPSSISR